MDRFMTWAVRSGWLRNCVVALAVGFAWLAGTQAAMAEWAPSKHMTKAIGRVMGRAQAITERGNLGFADDISFMAAVIEPKGEVTFKRTFQAGVSYVILGGGDDDTDDLDIELLDDKDRVVVQDNDADAAPVVRFTPRQTGRYTVKLKLYRARLNCFCACAILRNGGHQVPLDNLIEAGSRMLSACERVDSNTKKTVIFHANRWQWAVWGTVLPSGGEVTLQKLGMGSGERFILARGDNRTRDIDLFLLDSEGKTLRQDIDDDAIPQIMYRTGAHPHYGLRIKNVSSSGPSLVLTAVLNIMD